MTDEDLKKKAEESYAKQLKDSSYYETGEEGAYICGYIAGAKEMQEENEQLKKELLTYKDAICNRECAQVWSEAEKLKQQIEKMKCCGNCFHNNKPSDKEFCWNCERQLNDEQPIIKDEWEIAE